MNNKVKYTDETELLGDMVNVFNMIALRHPIKSWFDLRSYNDSGFKGTYYEYSPNIRLDILSTSFRTDLIIELSERFDVLIIEIKTAPPSLPFIAYDDKATIGELLSALIDKCLLCDALANGVPHDL